MGEREDRGAGWDAALGDSAGSSGVGDCLVWGFGERSLVEVLLGVNCVMSEVWNVGGGAREFI